MKVLDTKPLFKGQSPDGKRTYLSVHERTWEKDGKCGTYFMVVRGEQIPPPEEKRPDAVICIGVHHDDEGLKRLVLTSEFRVPLNCREVSFPAGIIDPEDFLGASSVEDAAVRAAIREFREETGLIFTASQVSPTNLYSSAGLTNESVIVVMGVAHGQPCTDDNEDGEDIRVMLLTEREIARMVESPDPSMTFSKVAWPYLWAFSKMGLML